MMGFGYGNWGPGYCYGYGSAFASGLGGGYWWTSLIGLSMQLLSWLLIIAVGIILFRWLGRRIPTIGYKNSNALNIVNERYARGEINTDEYLSLKKDLSQIN
ncbi:SHOCT domain-containing protein [Desulfosporosinus sp. PR]|uniref:SHOCT domain-containing protein n=1 Tax=Candidatus Desulfosporosinus nitrosoreducens TaxID=3401928 RepID=UPI0027F4F9FC|nr:SHOCT domain-containing protein [Desulfosporosinus sp. PR]MDQ7096635.1 SHOCT domain-containing protein [Desulfosporosinus sp. PR]